jgi:hypothetical protein
MYDMGVDRWNMLERTGTLLDSHRLDGSYGSKPVK